MMSIYQGTDHVYLYRLSMQRINRGPFPVHLKGLRLCGSLARSGLRELQGLKHAPVLARG